MKTFAIHTLGCKVNSYESQAISRQFELHDYTKVDFKTKADVYVINTCTVTNTGDAKSRKKIRQAIKQNNEAIICVVGCYAQVSPQEIEAIEGVDIILGTQYRDKLLDYIEDYQNNCQKIKNVDNIFETKEFESMQVETFTDNQRAFLKIQEGCNKFCTYCIIPYARGLMRSRKPEDVLFQAQRLVDNGYQELVLTGIHTAGYGEDFEDYSFDDLLYDLTTRVNNLKRLRISSIEATQITDRTLELVKNSGIIVNHLHIPLQAGSDGVLKRMKRSYNTQEFLTIINKIRQLIPDIAITTDLIVGFPQESDEEFNQTLDFLNQCAFFDIHVFPYSKRKGTIAAKMEGQVNDKIKEQRVEQVIKLTKELGKNYAKQFEDKIVRIIVESYDPKTGLASGHSDNYLNVSFKCDQDLIGQIVMVKITNVIYPFIHGEIQ